MFFYKEHKRTQRTPLSIIKNVKEHKNGVFFYKECKRTQKTHHSFYRERKRTRERCVFLKRMQKNARTLRSFEKNVCPTLDFTDSLLSGRIILQYSFVCFFSYKNKKVPSLPFQYMQNVFDFLWSQFCWAGGGFTNQIAYFPLCILMQYTYRYALIQSTLRNIFKLYIQDLVWKLILRYCTGHLTAAFDSISCIFREYRKCRWIDGNVL